MLGKAADISNDEWPSAVTNGDHDDPLLECLVILTRLHHRPMSANALSAGLPIPRQGMTPALFLRAATRAGLSARIVKRRLDRISPLVLPAVLLLKGRRACLASTLDASNRTITILQPESGAGEHVLGFNQLENEYQGIVIFVRAQHQFDERAPQILSRPSRHWFWGTLLRSWRIYRDVLVASLLVNLFALATPIFVMNVYDRVVPNQALETLWVLAIGVGIVMVFDLIMRALRSYFVDIAGKKAEAMLSASVFETVMGLKMEVRPVSVGAFANTLHDFDNIREFITSATVITLVDLPFAALFLAVMWFIGGSIAFVPLVAIAIVALYALAIQAPLREAVENTLRSASQKSATLVESLSAIETIKSLGAAGEVQRRWEQAVGYMVKWGVRSRGLSSSAVSLAVTCQQATTIGVVVWGVYKIGDASLSLGGLIACVILAGRATAPAAGVASLAVRYHQARAALKTLNRVMALPVERPTGKSFVRRPKLSGSIEFKDVSFHYPNQATEALDSVSFHIRQGERVAVIGRVGSGKSSIEKLIMGLYEPTAGAVRLDGIDVRQIDPADLRRNIGYVPQDVVLFFGSARDNITLGNPHADDEAIVRAARLSGLDEFINRHPQGFDMPIGERGEGLSGGQRQSVTISRAVLGDPPLLLMDEPTNAMDNSSEERLKSQFKGYLQDKTLVLVTHRASMLELVDRLIVLERGKLVADGPKDEVREALRQGKLHGSGS